MTGEVKFWVLLGNELALASAHLDDTIARLFRHLRDDVDAAPFIPAKVTCNACEFYRLNRPVTLDVEEDGERDYEDDDVFLKQVKKACWEESNRERVSPITRVRQLAETISGDYIHLAVKFPNGAYVDFLVYVLFTDRVAFLSHAGSEQSD